MLTINIPDKEMFDEKTQEFFTLKGQKLQLEHSLVSISKWESKWHKAFLNPKLEKTTEETIDYIRCMTITQNVDPSIYRRLTKKNYDQINNYIDDPMTATTFSENKSKGRNNEIPTSELIYYWMISLNIPMECQKWHLNRLLTLIRVFNVKSESPKKMSKREVMNRYSSLNAARRKQLNSAG